MCVYVPNTTTLEMCMPSPSFSDASDSIVSSILQQKLGIIIGCSIGLTCIALCVIFVWRYRLVLYNALPSICFASSFVCYLCGEINRISDVVEAETRKSQASFQTI